MNCFESRQEFSAIWRNRATPERRAETLAHLKTCAKCDHAFRVFALTAPVLHSESEPPARVSTPARQAFSLGDRPRRFASVSREMERPQRRWVAMSAAAAIFVMAGSAAFFSADTPRQTLGEELSMPDSPPSYEASADPLAPEMPVTESDFAS